MRILVSGDCSDWKFVRRKLDAVTINLVKPVIVTDDTPSGKLAQRWAGENYYEYLVTHEKTLQARHLELTSLATAAVIFESGDESKQSKDAAALAALCEHSDLRLRIIHEN